MSYSDTTQSRAYTVESLRTGKQASCEDARLDALTIAIPTYNRPGHLKRLLAFYRRRKLRTRFLVLDSSDQATVAENRAMVSSFGNRFRHVDFSSSLPVAAKLSQGLTLVETPYCAFCADDDFLFPDALTRALDFMESHADYVCADGIYLNFFPKDGEIQVQMEYGSRGIEAAHPGARVFRLFQRYESMFYAVFRTAELRDIFSFVKDIPSLHYQELFQAAAALLKGKTHRLPEFYAARQHCDPAEPARDKWQTFYWFADDSADFLSHYRAYRDELWRFYENFGTRPLMDAKAFSSAMDMAHAMFFSDGCPPEYFYTRLQQYWPTDAFKRKGDLISVYDELKIEQRFSWKLMIHNTLKTLADKTGRCASAVARRSFEQEAKLLAKGGFGWKCRVSPDLWWITSVPKFQTAFLEVCDYLGDANQ